MMTAMQMRFYSEEGEGGGGKETYVQGGQDGGAAAAGGHVDGHRGVAAGVHFVHDLAVTKNKSFPINFGIFFFFFFL